MALISIMKKQYKDKTMSYLRAQFQGKKGYMNVKKGILNLYSSSGIERFNIMDSLDLPVVREFLNTALERGQGPKFSLFHSTNKNSFSWNDDKLSRVNYTTDVFSYLRPGSEHTKDILQAMVRANVK